MGNILKDIRRVTEGPPSEPLSGDRLIDAFSSSLSIFLYGIGCDCEKLRDTLPQITGEFIAEYGRPVTLCRREVYQAAGSVYLQLVRRYRWPTPLWADDPVEHVRFFALALVDALVRFQQERRNGKDWTQERP